MFTGSHQSTHSLYSISRGIVCSLLLALTLSLLAGPVAAQNEKDRKRAAAEKLLNEGLQLNDEGTKESLETAIRKFTEVLLLFRREHDASGEAVALNNIGLIYGKLGEKQKALDNYAQALPLFRVVRDRIGEAMALNNIGAIYNDLGEKQRALDYLVQALPLRRSTGDQAGEAATLNNLAFIYDDLGEKQKALDYYEQALPLFRATGNRRGE